MTTLTAGNPELRPDSPDIQFADVLKELDRGVPVNTQDAINALQWTRQNQRREIARLHEKRTELRDAARNFHDTYCPSCPDNPCRLGIELRVPSERSDELTIKFPRAWAPYLQAVILGALGDMDGDGDCRWHLNELAKSLGMSSEKSDSLP